MNASDTKVTLGHLKLITDTLASLQLEIPLAPEVLYFVNRATDDSISFFFFFLKLCGILSL
jgi:hypothetical protein